MAETTRRGQLSVLWFIPVDMISFSQSLCVTAVIEGALSRTSV
jgi:hypothetical protein